MFAVNLDKLNVSEAELKAYIYQQLHDIESHLGEIPIGIKMTSSGNDFVVKMSASLEMGDIEAQGTGEDIFGALSKAKEALVHCIAEMNDSMEPDVRDDKINTILTQKKEPLH